MGTTWVIAWVETYFESTGGSSPPSKYKCFAIPQYSRPCRVFYMRRMDCQTIIPDSINTSCPRRRLTVNSQSCTSIIRTSMNHTVRGSPSRRDTPRWWIWYDRVFLSPPVWFMIVCVSPCTDDGSTTTAIFPSPVKRIASVESSRYRRSLTTARGLARLAHRHIDDLDRKKCISNSQADGHYRS